VFPIHVNAAKVRGTVVRWRARRAHDEERERAHASVFGRVGSSQMLHVTAPAFKRVVVNLCVYAFY